MSDGWTGFDDEYDDEADREGEDWKPEDASIPEGMDRHGSIRITPRVLRWATGRLVQILLEYAETPKAKIERSEVHRHKRRLVGKIRKFLRWQNTVELKPHVGDVGSWSLERIDVLAALAVELDRENRIRDEEAYPTLDEWLAADIAGKLEYKGDEGAADVLSEEWRADLHQEALERQRKRPRECSQCHEAFKPRQRNAKRCDPCLSRSAQVRKEPKAR